jgi:hypothetical protein
MQQRRLRPGDVLDDYCPRERRITDHAIVAMIDDHIKQTRCVVCDAEHEYKDGKLPPQRRKKAPAALFTQVLDGLQGPQPAARLAHPPDSPEPETDTVGESQVAIAAPVASEVLPVATDSPVDLEVMARATAVIVESSAPPADNAVGAPREEGFFRRSLIRATLPRPEGQQPPARVIPEFTIRQPNANGRGRHRPGRGRAGAPPAGSPGPMRFGRGDGQGQRAPGRGGHGANGHGANGHGANGNGRSGQQSGRPRRGGKKR